MGQRARAANGQFISTGNAVGGTLHRPSLRASTKRAIQDQARANGQVFPANFHYGHIRGFENRRILAAANKLGLNQKQLNNYVNARPQHFQIEDAAHNLSHRGEKPGIGGINHIVRDMNDYFGF